MNSATLATIEKSTDRAWKIGDRWRNGTVGVVVGMALAVCGVGCEAVPIRATNQLNIGPTHLVFIGASVAKWPADFDRLIYDIPRTVRRVNWGLLNVKSLPVNGNARSRSQPPIIRASALLPDGRTATVIAWPASDRAIGVALRVGHFGDRRQEGRFIRHLAQVLRGKPSRKHRQAFELPPVMQANGSSPPSSP